MKRPSANGQVAIRARADGQTVPTELVPAGATLSGDPVRLNMNRRYLARALKLGFREVHVFSPKAPVLCQDHQRSYVWALLTPGAAIAPASDPIRIDSPNGNTETQFQVEKPRRRKIAMTKSRAHADSRSKAGGRTDAESDGKPEPSGAVALVEQAEAVKASLKQALAKTGELISSLKRQHKQSKSVQAALASLRQLENVGA